MHLLCRWIYAHGKFENFAENHKNNKANIAPVGMFNATKTMFASPVMNKYLYELQKELHERLKYFDAQGWEWYSPNN